VDRAFGTRFWQLRNQTTETLFGHERMKKKSSQSRRRKKQATVASLEAPALPVEVSFPVVGIGASAGGLEALEHFLSRVPRSSGMANVSRHAKASKVEVSIQKLPGAARMEIKDDGKSFAVENILRAKGSKRLGLLGMRERMEKVGGTFCIESAPGRGTTVRVEMPFARVQKAGLKKSGNKIIKSP
jgi:hypothetical protein